MALKNNVNPNEVFYPNEKKPTTSVLKNTGDGNLLIWRQPEEDFNNNSILIVEPGEEAIFVNSGRIEEVFGCGRYKLHTKNYPFLSRLQMRSHGGVSSYNCLVYFVRKAHSHEILWGTGSPIRVRDKVMGIATTLGAYGSYKIQIDNPALFLEKLIGNNVPFETQENLNKYFVNEFQTKIKSFIAKYLEESDKEILGIDAHLDEISEAIRPGIQNILEKYGLLCVNFSVSAINIADDDLRRQYDEAYIKKHNKTIEAMGEKEVIDILDEDWSRVQAKDLLGKLADSPAGGVAAAGAGAGMGMAAGNAFGALASQAFTPANTGLNSLPRSSGRFNDEAKQQTHAEKINYTEALKMLKDSFDNGYITQEEFEASKKKILDNLNSSVSYE